MAEKRKYIAHYKIFDYWKDKAITKNGDIVDVNDEKYFDCSIEVVYDHGEPECFACRRLVKGVLEDEKYDEWLNMKGGLKNIWNHRDVKKNLQRCHIIPHSLNGSGNPENMFLMCKDCHEESPDTNNPKNFFRYVYRKRKSPNNGYKKMAMFLDECINRELDFSTHDFDEMEKNISSHGGVISDYTFSMGLADTCKELPEDITKDVMLMIQKNLYNSIIDQGCVGEMYD